MDKLYLTIMCIFIYESECVVPYNDVKADYETLLSAYRVRTLSLYNIFFYNFLFKSKLRNFKVVKFVQVQKK